MSRLEETKGYLEDVSAIRLVASALTDASARKISRLRRSFERNSSFYSEIYSLYAMIKAQAKKKNLLNNQERPEERRGVLIVAVTSNARFYGKLNKGVVDAAINVKRRTGADLIVVGRVGADFFTELGALGNVRYLSFSKDTPSTHELSALFEETHKYKRSLFIYSTFINLVEQKTVLADLNASMDSRSEEENFSFPAHGFASNVNPIIKDKAYIFEPELDEMILFFETEVRRILIQRIFFESELARTAARLMSMSRAEESAGEEFKRIKSDIRKIISSIETMRMLEIFSGIIQRKKFVNSK